MRSIQTHNKFRRDLKRVKHSGKYDISEINAVVAWLQADEALPEKLKDHPLKGGWEPARECHIRPDLLLVYEKTETTLYLLRLGSHAELF